MAQIQLFSGQVTGANLGSAAIDSVIQGDTNSMPFALMLVVDITAFTGTSLLPAFLFVDPVTGKKILYNAAFGLLSGVGTSLYLLGSPGIGAAAGGVTAAVN